VSASARKSSPGRSAGGGPAGCPGRVRVSCALFLLSVGGLIAAQGQTLPEEVIRLKRDWLDCQAVVDSLLRERMGLKQTGDSLAAVSAGSTQGQDRDRAAMARLASLAEQDDRLSGDLRRQELHCEALAGRLLGAVRRSLRSEDIPPSWPARDTLIELRGMLLALDAPSGRVDVALPEAAPGDGPEDLEFRAGLSRDLADRLWAWNRYVNRLRAMVTERLAVDREMAELLGDQGLLGDDLLARGALSGAEANLWLDVGLSPTEIAQVETLRRQAGLDPDGRGGERWTALTVLSELAEWLQLRRAALLLRAQELERAARRQAGADG